MKKICQTLWLPILTVLVLTGTVLLLSWQEDRAVYDKVIRLHILANSDSEQDQALKLTVRDALLEKAAAMTASCQNREEAEEVLASQTEVLRRIAEEALSANGCARPVTVTIGQEVYPTRQYEGLCLPAGEYCSLRVMIGEAAGQNWWCVLFPPLCVGSAAEAEEEMVSAGFTPGQIHILTDTDNPRYVLRFKILEILGSLFS